MTSGTKGGAQRASSLRPRCVGEVDPETATHIYLKGKSTPTTGSKAQRGSTGIALYCLDLGAKRRWVVSITTRQLYPWEGPGTDFTGGWVDPRAGPYVCVKPRLYWDLIPGPSNP
jgi:hypothetical protein